MTAEQLRNSILQEAISGRLVPQDPNDEPASALLARIREEKARLVKAKQISKRDFEVLPITEDDVDYEIPTSWEWVRLGDIFKHSTGKALNEANKKGTLQDYITTSNVYWGYFKLDKLRQMYYTEDEKEKCMATKGDLLVLEGGDVGRAAIWDRDYDIFLQNHIHKLRAYVPVCTEFYYYCLYLFHDMGLVGGKGIGIQGLSSGALHQIIFPLPPLAEQKRIVAKLEELLPIVEQYGKAQKELDELNTALPTRLRQSILQEAVQGKLTSHDEKDDWAHNFKKQLPPLKIKSNPEWPTEFPFDLPESWEWCRVGDICDILNGYAFKSDKYVESGINVIRISNVQDGKIINKDNKYVSLAMEKEIEDYMLQEGDLLMSLTGNVGRVGLLPKSMLPAALNQRVACLRLKDESIKPFLLWYLQSPVFRERCESSGHGMAQLNISTEWLKQEYIPLPPLAEQQRIVAKIEELFANINKISK